MLPLPSRGIPPDQVLARMRSAKERDVRWQEGRVWGLVYPVDDDLERLLREAYAMFITSNALNPMAFPSLKRFEAEVVAMTAHLLGGDEETVGNLTSGGTESLLMAVKTARDWARAHRPHITAPEMVLPASAHPAFEKASHYFGVRSVRVPVDDAFRADVEAMRAAITPNTILLVGSAPSYPQGVMDPIPELAAVAREHDLLFHVDACLGGFFLPFARRLGYPVPDFDFTVDGVTSISADLHKFGYTTKGASVILYRNRELRRHQFFVYTDWSGGVYASPTMAGSRPGGTIAAAWAVMHYLGEEGYLRLAKQVMETTARLRAGIEGLDGLQILGDPVMGVLAIGSDALNVYEVADELTLRGWHLERQQFPPSLHLTVSPAHAAVADRFLDDLAAAVERARRPSLPKLANALLLNVARWMARLLPAEWMSRITARSAALAGVRGGETPQRSAAMYGMLATLPNRGDLHELVLDILDQFTSLEAQEKR